MLAGIGIVGLITANIAALFLESDTPDDGMAPSTTEDRLAEADAKLDEIMRRLDQRTGQGGVGGVEGSGGIGGLLLGHRLLLGEVTQRGDRLADRSLRVVGQLLGLLPEPGVLLLERGDLARAPGACSDQA